MDAIAVMMPLFNEQVKHYYVIEGDFKSYFDTVHHRKLLSILKRRIADKDMLDLIWKFLKAGVMEEGLFAANRSVACHKEASSHPCSPTSTSTSSTSGQRRNGT